MPPRPSSPEERFDVVVIGGGPGGSVCGWHLARAGLKVLLLERHQFPRYHIGESLTGVAGDFIRELGLEATVAALKFPPKTGVKVVGRDARSEFFVPVLRDTWQVRRAEFDQMLLEHAVSAGVEHRIGSVKQILQSKGRVIGVGWRPDDARTDVLGRVRASCVVDASGHSAVLSRHGIAGPRRVDAFGRQIAIFSQYRNVERDPGPMRDNTFIFYSELYHWAWFIPLSADVVSIGVVLPSHTFKRHGDGPEEVLRWGLENLNPDLARRLRAAEQVEPVRFIRNYSYRITPFAGDGWICAGDAHRFADPIFSFGAAFAMVEGKTAAHAVVEALSTGDWRSPFGRYVEHSNRGQDAIYDLIRYFWRYPAFFGVQTRGALRKQFIRLLAGDCYDVEPIPALAMMRKSLYELPIEGLPPGRARDVARRVQGRYGDFQGVSAAYVEAIPGDGVQVTFVLEDEGEDIRDSLWDFEEQLYREFGRQHLSVLRWMEGALGAADPAPLVANAHPVFERSRVA